jgi:hypothetical protein
LPLGIIFLLTSCFYSGQYNATYKVQNVKTNESVQELSIEFINQLADKNSLSSDQKFNGIDTLGFHGSPYHSFKFWFEKEDSNTIVKLDY